MAWETVIGLEIHAQLATESKIFSGASTAYGGAPNTRACAVDLGLPGVLPVVNARAVEMAIRFGLATAAAINPRPVFARKNYFYPDLPKGYQISQYDEPIVGPGSVEIALAEGGHKRIRITRAHLEEDAGKSLHEDYRGMTGIDLNRAGTPLLEIVSEPDLASAVEAVSYARLIHTLVQYLRICDGNMQEGSFRCDANVSIRPEGSKTLGTRTELKNLNSFRFLEKAIDFEVERQRELLEEGGRIVQETRLYDPDRDETRTLRTKEEANDYRYFPDPDLLPLDVGEALVAQVRAEMPELPWEKLERFERELGLGEYDARLLCADRALAEYFERTVAALARPDAKLAANWIISELTGALNRAGLAPGEAPVPPERLAELLERISDETVSGRIAKEVFEAMWAGEGSADALIEARGLRQVSDTGELERLVEAVIAENPEQVEQLRAGKGKLLGYLVGQVMKKSAGKANPKAVNELIRGKLSL